MFGAHCAAVSWFNLEIVKTGEVKTGSQNQVCLFFFAPNPYKISWRGFFVVVVVLPEIQTVWR